MGITCFVNSEILFGRVPRSTRLLRTTSLGSVSAHTFFFFFFFLFFFFLFFLRDAYDSDCDPAVELKIGTVFFFPSSFNYLFLDQNIKRKDYSSAFEYRFSRKFI